MKLEFPKEFPPPPLSFFGSRFISRAAKGKNLVSRSILSLLRNSTETLATPATYRLLCIFKVTEKIASQTTMGFVIDDPTRPQDVGEAAKKFFNEGSNINCCGDWTPKYCPLFSINNHVLDWLSKPERERYHLIEVTFSFSYQYWK